MALFMYGLRVILDGSNNETNKLGDVLLCLYVLLSVWPNFCLFSTAVGRHNLTHDAHHVRHLCRMPANTAARWPWRSRSFGRAESCEVALSHASVDISTLSTPSSTRAAVLRSPWIPSKARICLRTPTARTFPARSTKCPRTMALATWTHFEMALLAASPSIPTQP